MGFQDDDTLVVREVGKNLFYRACVPDYRSKRLEMWRESHSLVSHYYHVSIDADAMRFYQYGNSYKDRDSRIFCLELVPQQDSLMQNTLNRIIGLTRLQSVTQYPIETIRSLRITDPDRQIILPDSDTGLFVSRMTDDHVAMAVFLHVFV